MVGEAGGRLCPRETHGRPWPCEWVARRHCVKRRGERLDVAKTRSERSGKRRDGAKRKVSEGSCLRLALVAAACRSSLRWRWWQWAIAVMHYCDAILGTHGSCSKSFWDSPLVEGPGRQVHPKTTTFCLVLGFTPLYTALQGTSIPKRFGTTLFRAPKLHYSAPFVTLPTLFCHFPASTPASAKTSMLPGSHPSIRKGVSASRCPPQHPPRRPHRPRWPRWRRGGFLCGRKSGAGLQPRARTWHQNQKDGDRGPRGRLRISDR